MCKVIFFSGKYKEDEDASSCPFSGGTYNNPFSTGSTTLATGKN